MYDARSDVRCFHDRLRGELALQGDVPLLRVAGTQRGIHGEDALTEAGGGGGLDAGDTGPLFQQHCGRNRVERALRNRLQEREGGRGERRGGIRDIRQVAAERVEGKRSRGRRRLDDIEPLPSPVEAGFQRVPALQQYHRIGDFGDAGVEVRRRVQRRANLLVTADGEGGQRVGEL